MELRMTTAYELGRLTARVKMAADPVSRKPDAGMPAVSGSAAPKPPVAPAAPPPKLPASPAVPPPPKPPTPPAAPPAQLEYSQSDANYFNPPKQNERIAVTPYNYMKPLYEKRYPGGYQGAIDDSQRWQEHAQLEGLPRWDPKKLPRSVFIATGTEVPKAEKAFNIRNGFSNNRNSGAFQENNLMFTNPKIIPEDYPAWWKEMIPHELTHFMQTESRDAKPIFKGHEAKFPPEFSRRSSAGVGTRSKLDYLGEPTEFGAHLSDFKRDWVETNPGRRISTTAEAEALLQHYNPANKNLPAEQKPKANKYFQELLPTIMSDPELKKKAIIAILSSVVQNKQRQAPGTNV
jgi:hypothetical protein